MSLTGMIYAGLIGIGSVLALWVVVALFSKIFGKSNRLLEDMKDEEEAISEDSQQNLFEDLSKENNPNFEKDLPPDLNPSNPSLGDDASGVFQLGDDVYDFKGGERVQFTADECNKLSLLFGNIKEGIQQIKNLDFTVNHRSEIDTIIQAVEQNTVVPFKGELTARICKFYQDFEAYKKSLDPGNNLLGEEATFYVFAKKVLEENDVFNCCKDHTVVKVHIVKGGNLQKINFTPLPSNPGVQSQSSAPNPSAD